MVSAAYLVQQTAQEKLRRYQVCRLQPTEEIIRLDLNIRAGLGSKPWGRSSTVLETYNIVHD